MGEQLDLGSRADSGDLVLAATPEAAHGELVGDYVAAVLRSEDAIMLAPRRGEVRGLNALARAELMRAGSLSPDGIEISGRRSRSETMSYCGGMNLCWTCRTASGG